MNRITPKFNAKRRNTLIDGVRGFAILVMIAANSWPYLVPSDYCCFGERLLFSTAAPIFIFLSGVSLCLAEEAGKTTAVLLKRILQILLIGFIIDIISWRIVPFYTFDVLYLIGFSLLIILGIRKFPPLIQWLIIFALLFAGTLLLPWYRFDLHSLKIDRLMFRDYSLATELRQLVLDGWFPLLPWSGIAALGYVLAKSRYYLIRFKSYFFITGCILLSLSIFLFTSSNYAVQPFREGYTEIFYPVKGFFWVLLAGLYSV